MGKKQKTNGGDAVIYARYSSHNQRDVSIEQQVEACRKHAAELGLTVTATYEDRAISGKTDKRPSFQRMMRDAEQHKFAYVLAWKSNRIGRNMMQALVNESRLVDCGVKVFYAEEDFDDNAAGRFALRSMMNVNQFYIENMAEDVKRGLYDNAKKGLVNGSLPLGYKRGADGKPEIDEPKAAIVREIYTRVAAGELFASIADDLNARGIKTARGREWNKGSFHVLCHNDRYRGIYMYGDIRIPGGMPRIISDELFYDAQEAYGMKKDNRYGRARHGAENYLLTGKLYCGHCGGYMVGISGTSKTGEMHYYYACQKHRLEHTCEKKAIRRDVIENAVARAIMMYCLDDETIDFIVDSTIAYFKQKDHELHIEAMENELAAVQQAISNLMKAIEAGIITPTTRTRLLDLEEQQAKLSAKINTAKAERVEIDRDDLIAGLQLFRTGDIKNKKFLAKLFNTFLIAVYLYDDNRLKIVFSFTGNHNSVEIPLELDNDCPDSEIVSDETEVRMSHLECRKNLGSPPSSGEAEKDDDCSDGRFVRTAPLLPRPCCCTPQTAWSGSRSGCRGRGRESYRHRGCAGALGKILLTVGETNGAVVAVHFHEAAQIHRLPHIVLGLALNLDAETGVIAVLFLGGVEDHHDVLLQLVEAVVHQPDELAANKAIALEGQTAVPLTILGVLLDSPQAHQGDKLAGSIEHQRLEVLEVLRLQVIQNLVIAAGLDVRHTVARLDTVNAKVAVDVQRAG